MIAEKSELLIALEVSLKLQSHYAELLNAWDGGRRLQFASVDEWISRLRTVGRLQPLPAPLDEDKGVDACPEPNNDSSQATHSATGDVSA